MGLRGRMNTASVLLSVLVAGTFVALFLSVEDLRRTASLERHSQEVLVAANQVERLVVDLQTGTRGFLLTGDETFLEPWRAARSSLAVRTGSLQDLVADNPEQTRRARTIADAAASYLADYSIPLVRGAVRDSSDAIATVAAGDGEARVATIRAEFDRLVAAERFLSTTRHDASEAAATRAIGAAGGGLAGSVVLVLLFPGYLGRLIVRPVQAMGRTAERIAEGDLTARASEGGVGEVALLGRSFNAMVVSVERSQSELARVAEEQSALRHVATLVARGAPSEDVFAAVTERVTRLCSADFGHMIVFEPDGTVTGIAGWSSGEGDPVPMASHVPLEGESVTASIFRTGRPSRMDSYADASGSIAASLRHQGIRSSVGAPIVVEGRLWGAVIASSKGTEPLPEDTESRLTAFTELIATAISNVQARTELAASRARIVAAADEARRRIERNLHDGTQQRLVSLGLKLRTVEARLPSGLDHLRDEMAWVGEGVEDVLEELREISRGIHPAILSQGGLGPALRVLARRSPIPVELDLRGDARVSEVVEAAAYYVASEALANAAKHSSASVATLELDIGDALLCLSIRDDGLGGADPARGSGLIGLKDRVEALGGSISVSSPIGGGTSITAELPVGAP
ncbi:MAG TPA: CHASE3 domain-containing protein [Actinomycetota bacterium]|nr:CHASE3 domain-containing protein [Actinomycetota bacterium]